MRIASRPLYRLRQVVWALRPRLTDEERAEAGEVLGERLLPLFKRMDAADQRHCFDVYRAARQAGCQDVDVLTAALIHDCGKAPSAEHGRIRLWHRVTHVALESAAPRLLRRLTRQSGGLQLLESHAERGLKMAESRGARPEVLELMRAMEHGDSDDERVRLLQAADDRA